MEGSRVRAEREARNLTQQALATAVGISRQSLGAIEGGRVDPSVAVALKLARALGTPVEQLFAAADDSARSVTAELASTPPTGYAGRVTLARIAERWVAHPLVSVQRGPSPAPTDLPHAADGLLRAQFPGGNAQIELLHPLSEAAENVVLLGCASALGLLAARLNRQPGPGHFVWLHTSSSEALSALAREHAHAAGVHLHDPRTGESNRGLAKAGGVRQRMALVTLARWEAGLVVPRGNPLGIHSVADFARRGLRLVARQPGAGTQQLLERELAQFGLAPERVLRAARIAHGHLEAAYSVAMGASDVAIAMRNAALAYELDFVPLGEERFDLALPASALAEPRFARLLELMNSESFRRELSTLGGYDAADCGKVVPRKDAA